MVAAQNDDVEMCRLLIENNCDVHATDERHASKDRKEHTALTIAAKVPRRPKRDYAVLRLLLQQGASLHVDTLYKPMTSAFNKDDVGMMTLFLDHGYLTSMCELKLCECKEDVLYLAIQCRARKCAAYLIHHGFYLGLKRLSYCPLAAKKHLHGIMRMLIDINPQYLQHFLLQNKFKNSRPNTIAFDKLWSWFYEESNSPRALQFLCKAKILQQFARCRIQPTGSMQDINTWITNLPGLPNMIKKFLQLPSLKEAIGELTK